LTVYLAAHGLSETIPSDAAQMGACWAVFGLCVIALPFWMWFHDSNRSRLQIGFAMISFVILVFTTGGPLVHLLEANGDAINSVKVIASITAGLFTGLAAPLISSHTS